MEHQNVNSIGKARQYKEKKMKRTETDILELCEVKWKDKEIRISQA